MQAVVWLVTTKAIELHCAASGTLCLALRCQDPYPTPPRLPFAGGLRRGRQISEGDLSRLSSETAAVGSGEKESAGAQCYTGVDRLGGTGLGASPPRLSPLCARAEPPRESRQRGRTSVMGWD